MRSLEENLVDRDNKIIKLLTPPFDKTKMEPGYIKAYIPGVRENGGQYTHAAIWAILAESMLDNLDNALELYDLINPINHAKTKTDVDRYKVEPYVIAGDVYGTEDLIGMGGWTWYTGSASWYYKVGLENILGFSLDKGLVNLRGTLPTSLKGSSIRYNGIIYTV